MNPTRHAAILAVAIGLFGCTLDDSESTSDTTDTTVRSVGP